MLQKFFRKIAYKLSWDLSTNNSQVIEFSAVKLCPVGCKYCPQTLLSEVTNKNLNSSNLTFANFKNYLEQISKENLRIAWTGYSEPLLNREFPDMVDYAQSLGIHQEISTTLTGNIKCLDYLSKTEAIEKITLHLPDNNGLMENGFLQVDDNYLERLRKILTILDRKTPPLVKLICFGKDYHPKIKEIINEEKYINKLGNFKSRQFLGSRSGAIKSFMPGIVTGKIGQYFRKSTRIPLSSISSLFIKFLSPKTNIYYCSYQRLNQPVILGDGKMNICCNDYSLRGIIGDLGKNKLTRIYKNWYKDNCYNFIYGKLEPCTDCEFYRPIRLDEIFKYYLKEIKSIFKKRYKKYIFTKKL